MDYEPGDRITIEGMAFEICSYGDRYDLMPLTPFPKCETFGCINPALDHTTQIAPATNVRLCTACAEAL